MYPVPKNVVETIIPSDPTADQAMRRRYYVSTNADVNQLYISTNQEAGTTGMMITKYQSVVITVPGNRALFAIATSDNVGIDIRELDNGDLIL